jgi:hypothetical protein
MKKPFDSQRLLYLATLALGLAACETTQSAAEPTFDRSNRVHVADRVRLLQEEQKAITNEIESTAKLSYVLAETEKPDQKTLDNFGERVTAINNRVDRYKDSLNDFEQATVSMLQQWGDAMTAISDKDLARSSRESLDQTRETYQKIDEAFRKIHSLMKQLATELRDQRTFARVNPADASAPLKEKLPTVEERIRDLRAKVQASESSADALRKKLTD